MVTMELQLPARTLQSVKFRQIIITVQWQKHYFAADDLAILT